MKNQLEDGIYFGMPEDDYHDIERLSNSAIQKLRISPADFWADSWLNKAPPMLTPEQIKAREAAKKLGRAYHCARLEPHLFEERFVRELSQADFAGVDGFLSTGTAMGEALAAIGEKKSGSVMEQAERLKLAGHQGPIWHLELAAWEANLNGRTPIPALQWENMLIDMGRIKKVPAVSELLTGGEAEVTILWTCPLTGIKMKARLDYLKVESWTDFKTFDNVQGKHLFNAIRDAFQYRRYHLQAVNYRDAVEMIRSGKLDPIGEATPAQRKLIEGIILNPRELDCHFVFQQKSGVPNIIDLRFPFFAVPMSTTVNNAIGDEEGVAKMEALTSYKTTLHEKAAREIKTAKRDFLAYQDIYPAGEEWLPFNPSRDLSDADFSTYWLDEEI